MLKLEASEVAIILNMFMNAQIQGKDASIIVKIMEKLQKELEKLSPDTLVKNG